MFLLFRELDNAVTEFTVVDSGIGISSSDIDLLFKPFGQVNTSYSRGYTGNKTHVTLK
jgi:signal transduction histidine kinase